MSKVFLEDGLSVSNDISLGGTIEGSGKCLFSFSNSQYTIEMTFPLNSTDSNGNDFCLAENSQIEFTCVYFYKGIDTYLQIQTQIGDLYYTILNIGDSTLAGISSFVLLVSLLSSMLLFSVLRRKRK